VSEARAFARQMIRSGLPLAPTGRLRISPKWTELVMYRDGPRQVELIIVQPGAAVPRHAHLRCDSVDFGLAGAGALEVAGHEFAFGAAGRLLNIPRDVPHSGLAGQVGAAYLSFQVWQGEPAFIADDWEPRA
jgi:quercetin dioxygenase-like cupin family protein